MPTATAPSENPLRLEVCPDCGYSLEGLPGDSACPECGRACDASMIVLYGWARSDHANLGNCSPETLVGYAVLAAILPACLYLFPLNSPILICLFLAFWCMMSLKVLRRFGVRFPGLVQIRLRDIGCEQRDDLRRLSMWKDIAPLVNAILWVGGGASLLFVARTNPAAWGTIGVYAVFSVQMIGRWWCRRWSTKLAGDAAAHGFVPWPKIDQVLFVPISADRHRLRLRCRTVWLSTPAPVDAEVHCSERQAEEVRRRIEEWRERPAVRES